MSAAHFTIATAGHVDHGKSALVKALTGTDPDRLPEEKARGITIDLGFARLDLPAPPNHPGLLLDLGIIDVPGHEDFVKNMVAGVGSVDLALMIVAADDGWMPQTEEHLQILEYLGVPRAVVALTKCDLGEGREPAPAVSAIRDRLAGTAFAAAPIVPTSVVTGDGLETLRTRLAESLAEAPPPPNAGKPRLAIDRGFSLPGFGTIVAGTLAGGSVVRHQSIILQPLGRAARIRTIQSHGRELDRAEPGMRIALNLPEIPLASGKSPGAARGQVVTVPELGPPSHRADVELRRSPRLIDSPARARRPLRHGTRVWIHHGSAAIPARVLLDGGGRLEIGGRAFARIQPDDPWFVLAGDRFIVRDWPGQATLAGGTVLDVTTAPRPKAVAPAVRRCFLERRARSPVDAWAWIESVLMRDGFAATEGLLAGTRFGASEIEDGVQTLAGRGEVLVRSQYLVRQTCWDPLLQQAAGWVDEHHQAHPDQPGLPLNELRNSLAAEGLPAGLTEDVIADLCRGEFRRTGTTIQRGAHRASLPAHIQSVGARLRTLLARNPIEPPSRKELAGSPIAQQVLRFLVENGEAIEVGPELVLSSDGFAQAREKICLHLQRHGPATASDLRQALGTSRRVIIPLLERLDRDGVTIRRGDLRLLR